MDALKYIQETREVMINGTDPRVKDWPMMQDPAIPFGIIFCYYLMVFLLPKVMARREAFKLREALIVYNFFLVFLTLWIIYENLAVLYLGSYSMVCEPVNYSPMDAVATRICRVTWWFYFSKIIELADTLFFILRKKNDQVSFLHVFHHSTMPLVIWAGSNYIGGGQVWMVMVANSVVHVVMYTYYALAAVGPHMHRYLWWKRHLTKLQLTHFFVVQGHALVNMIFAKDCPYPSLPNWTIVFYANTQAVLFANFYYNAYVKKQREIKLQGKKQEENHGETNGVKSNGKISNGISNGVAHTHDMNLRSRGPVANGHVVTH